MLERKPSLTGIHAAANVTVDAPAPTVNATKQTKSEVAKNQTTEEEEENDWLAGALSRKKALTVSDSEANIKEPLGLKDEGDLEVTHRYRPSRSQSGKYSYTHRQRKLN